MRLQRNGSVGEAAPKAQRKGEPFFGFRGEDLLASAGALAKEAVAHPTLLLERQAALARDVARILAGRSDIKPSPKDKRFSDKTWTENPFYEVFLSGYLAWCKALEEYIEQTTFDERTKARARFIAGVITSALSPSNTLVNPVVLKRVIDTGGTSIVLGLKHMLADLFSNNGMPSQVDKRAFEVGQNLGISEGSVVFRSDVLELIQYKPRTQRVYSVPILFVPPQINKFYVFDLSPENSLFAFLIENGLQVFTISWRNPTPEERDWGLDTYVSAILDAMVVVRRICKVEKLNAAGACAGGMTLSALLGYLAAGEEDGPVKAATHMVSALGVREDSLLGMFATKDVIALSKAASGLRGTLEGSDMGRIFAWLRPDDLVWNYWLNNYLLGKDPPAFDVLYWNNDTTRLPARFHADLLDAYAEGKLLAPGEMTVLGRPIDLQQVTLDAYFTAGITDHIAPWKAVYQAMLAHGGTKTFVLSAAGHIQSVISPPAAEGRRQYVLNPSNPADPQEWLKGATPHTGSWWRDWLDWLRKRSGEQIVAPAHAGSDLYPPLEKAPGSYVLTN